MTSLYPLSYPFTLLKHHVEFPDKDRKDVRRGKSLKKIEVQSSSSESDEVSGGCEPCGLQLRFSLMFQLSTQDEDADESGGRRRRRRIIPNSFLEVRPITFSLSFFVSGPLTHYTIPLPPSVGLRHA